MDPTHQEWCRKSHARASRVSHGLHRNQSRWIHLCYTIRSNGLHIQPDNADQLRVRKTRWLDQNTTLTQINNPKLHRDWSFISWWSFKHWMIQPSKIFLRWISNRRHTWCCWSWCRGWHLRPHWRWLCLQTCTLALALSIVENTWNIHPRFTRWTPSRVVWIRWRLLLHLPSLLSILGYYCTFTLWSRRRRRIQTILINNLLLIIKQIRFRTYWWCDGTTTFDPEAWCDSNHFEYLVWQATECLPFPESHALQPGVFPSASIQVLGGGTLPGNFMKSLGTTSTGDLSSIFLGTPSGVETTNLWIKSGGNTNGSTNFKLFAWKYLSSLSIMATTKWANEFLTGHR